MPRDAVERRLTVAMSYDESMRAADDIAFEPPEPSTPASTSASTPSSTPVAAAAAASATMQISTSAGSPTSKSTAMAISVSAVPVSLARKPAEMDAAAGSEYTLFGRQIKRAVAMQVLDCKAATAEDCQRFPVAVPPVPTGLDDKIAGHVRALRSSLSR
jgi:hypothetical protein